MQKLETAQDTFYKSIAKHPRQEPGVLPMLQAIWQLSVEPPISGQKSGVLCVWMTHPKVILLCIFTHQISSRQTYLISRNSSIPYFPPSRPIPDSFTPPKGTLSPAIIPVLTPMIPYSSASDTLHMRLISRE